MIRKKGARRITVCLGEVAQEVGTLVFQSSGARRSVSFAYMDSWLNDTNAFPLSPDLPLNAGYQYRAKVDHSQSAFFGCIADTEPDGWGRMIIKRDHAKKRRARVLGDSPIELLDDLDFLLWINDYSRMGALRFRDESGIFCKISNDMQDAPALVDLAQLLSASKALEENRETVADLEFLRENGTSLGGLRPKCTIRDKDGSLAIGKFPSVNDTRSIVHGEVLALKLAADAGIDAARARIIDSNGVPVAVITRFDRINGKRIMYLSGRSILQATSSEQYSYVDLADALRMYSGQATKDLHELWRRIVFNILINNVDDHLNNHGFLHQAHGQWRLAPAFDLNPFPDKDRSLKTWISREAGDEASLAEAVIVAPLFGFSKGAEKIVLEEVRYAVKRWKRVARSIGMSAVDIANFEPAFEHPEL